MNPYYQPYWKDEDSLQHYGVLGMKWGVRKDPKQAYERAGAKLKKLDRKVEKGVDATEKKMAKAWAKNNRAQRAILFKGVKRWRAAGQTNRTLKSYARTQNTVAKAMRWQKSMEKAFKDVKLDQFDKDTEALGAKYRDMTLNNLMSSNVSMNALYDMYARNKTRFNR